MIKVKVKAIMHVAEILGNREQVVLMPEGSRLSDLLDTLEEKYGQPLTSLLYKNEARELDPELSLLLNGRNIIFLDGLETILADGDELFFLSRIGGG